MSFIHPVSVEDLATCGLLVDADEERDDARWKVEQAKGADEYEIKKKVLLGWEKVEEMAKELVGRVETVGMVRDTEMGLKEVRAVEYVGKLLEEQVLGRDMEALIKNVLGKCTQMEAQFVTAGSMGELDSLHSKAGVSRVLCSRVSASATIQDLNKYLTRDAYSDYTKRLLAILHKLELVVPASPRRIYHSDDGEAMPVTVVTSAELSICTGAVMLPVPGGVYSVGRDVGTGCSSTRASRLLTMPQHDGGSASSGHHLHWNVVLKKSLVRVTSVLDDSEATAPHFSSNILQKISLGGFEVTKDVVRRSHLIKMMDSYPKIAAVAGEWLDKLEQTSIPTFLDGIHIGYEWVSIKDDLTAVDREHDPAVEVPYNIAAQIAEAVGGRVPTWQEWEVASAGGETPYLHTWGDDIDPECIDITTYESPDGVIFNEVESFGWLRHSPSPYGLVGLCRYGCEWNSANFDVTDSTGGLLEVPTTHVYRSCCDFRVAYHAGRRESAYRGFTMPCVAAYGVPHRGVHTAAFRLAFNYPQEGCGPEKFCVTFYQLISLLKMSNHTESNEARVYGLAGRPESVERHTGVHQHEEWYYLTKGFSLEVTRTHKVFSVTVYDKENSLPRSRRRFPSEINHKKSFPLHPADLRLPPPTRTSGLTSYHTTPPTTFSWWGQNFTPPMMSGRLRPASSKPTDRFPPDTTFTLAVAQRNGQVASVSVTVD